MKNILLIILTLITFNLTSQTIKLKDQIINETNIYKVQSQPLAIIDTIPVIDGMDQARLDSMGVIGLAKGSDGVWRAATAARDTLYPNAFCYGLLNGETEMLIAYSGVIQLDSAYFTPGTVYYQPYDYVKYSSTQDTILEQLAFKALDGNQILIRDRYSYLAENRLQSERGIPTFEDTTVFKISDIVDNTLLAGWIIDTNYASLGTEVSAGVFEFDSLECVLGTKKGLSEFDLIPTGFGVNNPTIVPVNEGTTGQIRLIDASLKARGTSSLGTNISYFIVWQHAFTLGRQIIVSEVTDALNTTYYMGNIHSGDEIMVSTNNSAEFQIATPYPDNNKSIGVLGWTGTQEQWNIKTVTSGNAFDGSTALTAYNSGTHAASSITFDQPLFGAADDGSNFEETASVRYNRVILIFQGQLDDTEVTNLAQKILANKTPQE